MEFLNYVSDIFYLDCVINEQIMAGAKTEGQSIDNTNSSVATLSCYFSCEKPFLNLYLRAVTSYKYVRSCEI